MCHSYRVVLEGACLGGELVPGVVRYGNDSEHLAAGPGLQEHKVPAEAPRSRAQRGRCRARDGSQAGRRQEDEQEGEGREVI